MAVSASNLSITTGSIAHAVCIDMVLGDTTYRITDAPNPITIDSNEYTSLGSLLNIGEVQNDYKSTQGSMSVVISGIPNTRNFMQIIQDTQIKGGEFNMYRVFFDPATMVQDGNAYLRYKGVISNFNIEENTDFIGGVSTNTLLFNIQSVFAILNKKITGQRTNGSERRRFYPGDISFDRVKFLSGLPRFG